jgi:hypothetical protein
MMKAMEGKCPHCNREDIPLSVLSDGVKVDELKRLLKASAKQIMEWAETYGKNNPAWLPPAGNVKLLEAIDEALNGVKDMKAELDEARKLTHEQLNTPFTI